MGRNTQKRRSFVPRTSCGMPVRRRGLKEEQVPPVCVLDPDGDIARFLVDEGAVEPSASWPGYHTTLYRYVDRSRHFGVVPHAVGGSFATLVAEQLFASGCRLLISITSAGQVVSAGTPPYFIFIDRALRDEGTSYHYVAPEEYVRAGAVAVKAFEHSAVTLREHGDEIVTGSAWTTDAPFRETESALLAAREEGILAVEMESASLYAFSAATGNPVVCVAHVTNQMAVREGDFYKGDANGSISALRVISAIADATGVAD